MHSTGFVGIFAPRAVVPAIAGVPQTQEQNVEVVLHSTGGDRQHRVTDRGMQYHGSWRNCGGDSACAFHRCAVVAFRATDYGENVEVIQLVHLHCGADRGRVNATDHEGLLGFAEFLGAPVSDTGAGGASTPRESDSRVGPANFAQLVRCVVWTYTLRLRQSASGTTNTTNTTNTTTHNNTQG